MKKLISLFVISAFLFTLVPVQPAMAKNGCDDCEPFLEVDLIAGQHNKVGKVTVTNDENQICVTYALDDDAIDAGWGIYETHLYVGDCKFDGVLTRPNRRLGGEYKANPIPGAFPYGDDELDGVEYYTECIPFEDLGFGICTDVCIAAHAVVERIVQESYCETDGGEITPNLTWSRSSEDDVPNFPGYGAQWNPETEGFTIQTQLTDEDYIWDGGEGGQYFTGYSTRSDVDWASWDYAASTPRGGNYTGYSDLRRFNAIFELDADVAANITSATLKMPDYEDDDVIPINDNVYIFLNEDLQFWGGTRVQGAAGTLTTFQDMDGVPGIWISNKAQQGVLDITDGWYIPGTFPNLETASFSAGENNLDVFTEENQTGGGMAKLELTLEYEVEECYPEIWEDQTAWGEGKRFNERGNWGMFFEYKICPPEECVPASVIYGVAGNGSNGGLWQIEITDEGAEETLLIALDNVGGATNFYPNGLAYDDENNRLYFAIRKSGSTAANLYFYDFNGHIKLAATGLPGEVYGATWGAGKYWYIRNGFNDMRTVTFDGNGLNGVVEIFEANFAGGKSFNFGDMALAPDEPVIYVSTSFSGTNKEFFKYDLTKDAGKRYSLITTTGKAVGLQLGFGEDEVLYGHSTFGATQTGAGAREWFAVDKAGTVISVGFGQNAYNDLASGPSVCK